MRGRAVNPRAVAMARRQQAQSQANGVQSGAVMPQSGVRRSARPLPDAVAADGSKALEERKARELERERKRERAALGGFYGPPRKSSAGKGVAYASALLGDYPKRQGKDQPTIPIKPENVVFERPKVIKSLSALNAESPVAHPLARSGSDSSSGSSGAGAALSDGPRFQMEPESKSLEILGAKATSVRPINSSVAGSASGRWGRQLEEGSEADVAEVEATVTALGSALDGLFSAEKILEKSHSYERSHTYDKPSHRRQSEQSVVGSMDEVQTATANNSGPSFLGQSAKALLKAQGNPRDISNKAVEVKDESLSQSFGVPQIVLGSTRDQKSKQKKKEHAVVPPQERLLSCEAKLLLEYFTPYLQEKDLLITDVRLQLERVPLVVVRPQGGVILGVLCSESFEDLVDNPRILLYYAEQLQRYRQRLAELVSHYLHLHIYQGLTLFDAMTGFICLENLNPQQVRKLAQFCSAHRIIKERRDLVRLFTDQDDNLRVMCPLEGMNQYCHNYLQQNFHRRPEQEDKGKAGKAGKGEEQKSSSAKKWPLDNGDHSLDALNLAEAFSQFLQLQVESEDAKASGTGNAKKGSLTGSDADSRAAQRETLRQLQEYLEDAHIVSGADTKLSSSEGEIWLSQCQRIRALQARESGPDIFERVPPYNEKTKEPSHRIDWDKLIKLCRYLNHSYQPAIKAVRVYEPNQEFLTNPSIVAPRSKLHPIPDVGQNSLPPRAPQHKNQRQQYAHPRGRTAPAAGAAPAAPASQGNAAQGRARGAPQQVPPQQRQQSPAQGRTPPQARGHGQGRGHMSQAPSAAVPQHNPRMQQAAHIQARRALSANAANAANASAHQRRAQGPQGSFAQPQQRPQQVPQGMQGMQQRQMPPQPSQMQSQRVSSRYVDGVQYLGEPAQQGEYVAGHEYAAAAAATGASSQSRVRAPQTYYQEPPMQAETPREFLGPKVGAEKAPAFAQSLAVPASEYAAQQARYSEAAALGRNVGAPDITSTSYQSANMGYIEDEEGESGYSMDFSLRTPGSGAWADSVEAGALQAPAPRRYSTMTSVSVADVNFMPSPRDGSDEFADQGLGDGEQIEWQGALPVAVSTMNLGSGYNPMQMAQRIQSNNQQAPAKIPASNAAQAQGAAQTPADDSVEALVEAALSSESQKS